MIYFDNAATTKPYPQVLKTYTDVATRIWGNPSSLHSLGNTADKLLELSRKQIAELLNVNTNEIYFTSGGTESDNWLLKGTALEKEKFGKHIIVSAIEHPAINNLLIGLKNVDLTLIMRLLIKKDLSMLIN